MSDPTAPPTVTVEAAAQPKPSRFQFVPVPGEFTRGRWKCRDSYHPYAETLEFEKKTSKEEANPDKISVSFKLRQSKEEEEASASGDMGSSSTIQVTSVKSTNGEMVEEVTSSDNIVITRKNGVTIVRKPSTAVTEADGVGEIRELSIDDFETKQQKVQQVPPTPMNTPPATLLEPIGESLHAPPPALAAKPKIFQVQSVIDSTPTRKFSDTTVVQQHAPEAPFDDSAYSATLPAQKGRVFQVEPVVDPQFVQQSLVPEIHLKDEPTFQVIQTEESKNMSLDSVKNVIDMTPSEFPRLQQPPQETPTKSVEITVSAASDKKEPTTGSLETCGIPIPPTAPHSTPYGTPKDTQKFPAFDDAFHGALPEQQSTQSAPQSVPVESSTISVLSQEKPADKTTSSSAPLISGALLPPVSVNVEPSLPIDNKIEQAMELVKTHLTYAVREEVDTLRNTIADLEYQMREFQFECSFYRQNCPPETVEAANSYVRQQMAKLQPPARRAVSTTCAPSMEGIQQSGNANSTHMRNLQTQIQQIKQIIPVAIVPKPSPTNSSTPSTTSGVQNDNDSLPANIHVNNMSS